MKDMNKKIHMICTLPAVPKCLQPHYQQDHWEQNSIQIALLRCPK